MESKYRQTSHIAYDCRYHVVFVPKYRYRVLDDEKIIQAVQMIFTRVCDNNNVVLLEGKIRPNHVHLYLSIPPKYSISQILKWLKGESATYLFKHHPQLMKIYWGRRFWAKGYFVSTVGITDEIIKKYIENQEEQERLEEELTKQQMLWK